MTSSEATAPDRRTDDPAYAAVPVPTTDRPGPWPGVVMVHDAFGVSDDTREQADWLAAAGYVVHVPDLFDGRLPMRCVKAAFGQIAARRGPAFDQLEAARVALAAGPECTGTVGVIGYCMGGGFALLLAARPGWSAASVNYGTVPDDVVDLLRGACPIVASFGRRDRNLRGAAERLATAARTAGVEHDVYEYPGAGHAFINRLAVASPLVPLMKVAGVGYHHPSAADAKRRILAFFDLHLRDASA